MTLQKPSVSSWLAVAPIALLGGLAAGGAASAPDGLLLGWPGWAVVVGIGCGAAALALTHAPHAAAAWVPPAAGLLAPVLLSCAGVPLAGVSALSGPPLAALALGGAVIVVSRSRCRPPSSLFLPLAFAALLVPAGRSHVSIGPEGDEPHYLMVADSLLRDFDLSLERDYAEGRYASFHDTPLAPHFRVRGKGGEVYSLHAVGLSVLILPAWALAGYAGVTVFMALVAAVVAREVREWARQLTGREPLADAAGWLAVLAPPLVHYAGLVFTEVPAALALSFGLRLARRDRVTAKEALAVGGAAALLPWLNVRYAPLAVVVVAHALYRHRHWRPLAAVLGPCLVSAAGLLAYHQALYGFWDPRRVYGRRPELSLATLAEGLPGLLLDQEFGLLVYAPVLVLAIPGLAWLLRRDRALGVAATTAAVAVVLTAGTWHMWRGGFNPPGRFLVPIAPLLLVAVVLVWERRGLTAGAALLVGWTLWTGLAGAWEPRLVHRDRDGTAPFFRERSGAREWTALLPAFVLSDPDRHRLAALWAVALVAAVPWRRRAPTAARLAAASLGLVAAAQVAAGTTHQRTGDRDAARLVGRPALHLPGFGIEMAAGRWTTDTLSWGPLYEPHRHPAGAEVGRRLALAPGSYRFDLEGEGLHGRPPSLRILPDRPGAPHRWSDLSPTEAGWGASFVVRPGEKAVNLVLMGGGPLLVRRVTLRLQPPATGSV